MCVCACACAQVELQRAVQDCSEAQEGSEDDRGGEAAPRRDVHQHLLNILSRLLQDGRASGEGGGTWETRSHVHTALNF